MASVWLGRTVELRAEVGCLFLNVYQLGRDTTQNAHT